MFERNKTFLLTIFWSAAALLIGFGVWSWMCSTGRSEIEKVARERNLCKQEGCVDGIAFVEDVIASRYKMSSSTIEWCLGVDDLRHTRVHRGGLIKTIAVDFMDMPCGPMKASTADDPAP